MPDPNDGATRRWWLAIPEGTNRARTTNRLRPVLSIQDRIPDRRKRVSVPCSKLDRGDAEALARLGEFEAIQIEKTNHFTVPGISEPFEHRGKAGRVERAANLKQLAKHLETRLEDLGGGPLWNPKPLASGALRHALEADHAHHLPLSSKWDSLDRRQQLVSLEPPFNIGEGFKVRPWTPEFEAMGDPPFCLHLVRQRSFGPSACRIPLGSPVGASRNPARRGNRLHHRPSDVWKRKRREGSLRGVVGLVRTLGLKERESARGQQVLDEIW